MIDMDKTHTTKLYGYRTKLVDGELVTEKIGEVEELRKEILDTVEKVARARKICDFITECAIDIWNGDSNADSATFTVDITPTGAYCKVAHYTEKKF